MSKILNKVLNIKELEGLENFNEHSSCVSGGIQPDCCSFHFGAISNEIGGRWDNKNTAKESISNGVKSYAADPDYPYEEVTDENAICPYEKPTCIGYKKMDNNGTERMGQCVKLPEKEKLYRNERLSEYEQGRVESLSWWNSNLITPIYFLVVIIIVIKVFFIRNYFAEKTWYIKLLLKLLLIAPFILYYFYSYNVLAYILTFMKPLLKGIYNIIPIDYFNYELDAPSVEDYWYNPIVKGDD